MTENICKVLLIDDDDDDDDYIVTRDFLEESEQLSFKLNWVDDYDQGLVEIAKNGVTTELGQKCTLRPQGSFKPNYRKLT